MLSDRSRSMRRRLGLVGVLSAVVVALSAAIVGPAMTADAAVGSSFNPGNIISDAVFYNGSAMSSAQVQGFIDSKERCAAGYTCLENYRESTFTRAADAKCGVYNGVASQLASDIIVAVAQACSINPQVLLTVLEKEQGLVSSNSPSAAKYRIAMGFGCPDTAACDTQYYGFYNQVYNAARQYQVYRLSPGSFSYRAGRVNNILYSPNGACGTGPVYIENQATAGLYDYTPYQPNAAALANMYGTGDGCSAYGNRNFWRIFSDWFGNPQGGGWFAKTADSATIYLLTADHKYPVPNGEILNAYYGPLGPYRVVSADYLAQFTTGIPLGQTVRDSTTGNISYFDQGVGHHAASCDQLVAWATSCSNYVDLTPTEFSALAVGSPLSSWARSAATGAMYYVSGGSKSFVHSIDEILRINGGNMPNYADLGATALATLRDGPDYVTAGTLIQANGQGQIYLVDGATHLVPVANAARAADVSSSPIVPVTASTVSAFQVGTAQLNSVISCSNGLFLSGGGQVRRLTSNTTFGLPITALDPATCAALSYSPASVGSTLFIRSSSGSIYYVTAGMKSHMNTMTTVYAINGPNPLVLSPLSDDSIAAIPQSRDILGWTQLVKTANDPAVYLVDGFDHKIRIASFAAAAEYGISGYSVVADAMLAPYATSSGDLSMIATCGGANYVAGGGQLYRIASNSNFGVAPTALDPLTCGSLPISGQTVANQLFVRSSGGAIYQVANGRKYFMSSIAQIASINGGSVPAFWVQESDTVLATLVG